MALLRWRVVHGNTTLVVTDNFELAGIALGTIVTVVTYHMVRAIAPRRMRDQQRAELTVPTPRTAGEQAGDAAQTHQGS